MFSEMRSEFLQKEKEEKINFFVVRFTAHGKGRAVGQVTARDETEQEREILYVA